MVPGTLYKKNFPDRDYCFFTSVGDDVPVENLPLMRDGDIYVYLGPDPTFETFGLDGHYGIFMIPDGTVWITSMKLVEEL